MSCTALRHLPSLAMAALLITAVADPAQAVCVTDGAGLQAALNTASTNGTNDEIRITSGTKQRNAGNSTFSWSYASPNSDDLTISGGWNAGCTDQNRDPRATKLNGSAAASVLSIWLQGGAADVQISNLSFEYGMTQDFALAAGLNIYANGTASPTVMVERVVARLNDQAGAPGYTITFETEGEATGIYTLRNSQIDGNRMRALQGRMRSGSTLYLVNNTVVDNEPPNTAIDVVDLEGAGIFWVSNNVFADNLGASDLSIATGTPTFLRNNHIGALSGVPGSNQGMTTGDPRLSVDVYGWLRPRFGSPLRDSGFNAAAGGLGTTDLIDITRKQGPAVDRGAFETDGNRMFADGFENQ